MAVGRVTGNAPTLNVAIRTSHGGRLAIDVTRASLVVLAAVEEIPVSFVLRMIFCGSELSQTH